MSWSNGKGEPFTTMDSRESTLLIEAIDKIAGYFFSASAGALSLIATAGAWVTVEKSSQLTSSM